MSPPTISPQTIIIITLNIIHLIISTAKFIKIIITLDRKSIVWIYNASLNFSRMPLDIIIYNVVYGLRAIPNTYIYDFMYVIENG